MIEDKTEKSTNFISPNKVKKGETKGYKKGELNWKLKRRKWSLTLWLYLYFTINIED